MRHLTSVQLCVCVRVCVCVCVQVGVDDPVSSLYEVFWSSLEVAVEAWQLYLYI